MGGMRVGDEASPRPLAACRCRMRRLVSGSHFSRARMPIKYPEPAIRTTRLPVAVTGGRGAGNGYRAESRTMSDFNYEIDISEQAGVRSLHFSSDWVQGAMRVSRPWALELDYTREMMACLALRAEPEWPRRALLIGLGAASLTKFLYRHRPQAKLTVVEIDPAVVAAARQFFKLPDDAQRIRIEIGDGAAHVARSGPAYDLILVDGYDADGKSGMLDTLPFYLNCKARLADGGLLVTNLLSRRKNFARSVERLGEAFDGRALAFPSCDSGNAVAFAAVGEPVRTTLVELKQAMFALKRDTGLNLLPTLVRLERARSCTDGRLEL